MYRKDPVIIDKETLHDLYYVQKLSIRSISEETGCSFTTIRRLMKQYEMKARTNSEAQKNTVETRPDIVEQRAELSRKARNIYEERTKTMAYIRSGVHGYCNIYKSKHPMCEECSTNYSEDVHHVYPLHEWYTALLEEGLNDEQILARIVIEHYQDKVKLKALCKSCHINEHKKGQS